MVSSTLFDRIRYIIRQKDITPDYEPVDTECEDVYFEENVCRPVLIVPDESLIDEQPFSWIEYVIFIILGISMLWAWNMFLAAAPYFQSRFSENKALLTRFQPAITSISCVTSLLGMIILTHIQSNANYPKRIILGLLVFIVAFSLLSISTSHFRGVSPEIYFVFTLFMVFCTSVATSLCQNGAFAFAASFGRPEYIQAVMTGQAIAGVLPAIAEIMFVLSVPEPNKSSSAAEMAIAGGKENTTAALAYFITATAVCIFTILVVIPLLRKHYQTLQLQMNHSVSSFVETEGPKRQGVSMWTLYKKLHWLAASVFLCFSLSMFYPVFTERIISIIPENEAPRLFRPSAFIPLGFLSWNAGDLIGRLITLGPLSKWHVKPITLFILNILRIIFIPLYFLCNIRGNGAIIRSDTFYLIIVSGGFGFTNGLLSSLGMMRAVDYVDPEEREASGGFMVVNLMAGLMTGSLLSFAISGVGS